MTPRSEPSLTRLTPSETIRSASTSRPESVSSRIAIFGSLPGPFMMFSGGEIGIEQLLPKLAQVKRSKIWLTGEIKWWTEGIYPDGLFAISRQQDGKVSASLVNFTDKELIVKNVAKYQLKSIQLQIGDLITVDSSTIKLPPFTGAVVELEIG